MEQSVTLGKGKGEIRMTARFGVWSELETLFICSSAPRLRSLEVYFIPLSYAVCADFKNLISFLSPEEQEALILLGR